MFVCIASGRLLSRCAVGRASAAMVLALMTWACDSVPSTPAAASNAAERAARRRGVELKVVPAGDEPVTHLVVRELRQAQADERKLIVYVGASWCEPCRRFHDAVKAGELDEAFPKLRLLEFDQDRDGRRLAAADCSSERIPLFAVPTSDGRCSQRRTVGAVKGAAAVAHIQPRLARLLKR